MLSNYGINSNTSANSFLKCIFRKVKDSKHLLNGPPGTTSTVNHTGVLHHSAVAVNKVHLTAPQAHTHILAAPKETSTAKNVKRRQKSVIKERVAQH